MDLERHQRELREQGFTLTSEAEMGLAGLRHQIQEAFFNERALPRVADVEGPVQTRYRSKDLIHYRRDDDGLRLRETGSDRFARIRTSGDSFRFIPRFRWFDVPGCEQVVKFLLEMIPPEQRHPRGAFGIHGFRSVDTVVHGPHWDGFEFGGTYVVDRTCGGAVSYLYDQRQGGRQVLDHQLQPGEILWFHERFPGHAEMFLHGATPLDGTGFRDALVIQADAPEDVQAADEELREMGDL